MEIDRGAQGGPEANLPNVFRQEVVLSGAVIVVEQSEGDVLHNEEINLLPPGQVSRVYDAAEFGPCGGVRMALQAAEGVHNIYGSPENPIALNAPPTNGADSNARFGELGLKTGIEPDEITPGQVIVSSAHGDPVFIEEAKKRGAIVYNSICPFVRKTHNEILETSQKMKEEEKSGRVIPTGVFYLSLHVSPRDDHQEVVGSRKLAEQEKIPFLIIHGEAEIEAALSRAKEMGLQRMRIVSQTTNSSEKARSIAEQIAEIAEQDFPDIDVNNTPDFRYNPNDVCLTVTDRQVATKLMVRAGVGTIIVVGSIKSENTKTLIEVAVDEAKKMDEQNQQFGLRRVILANSHYQVPRDVEGIVGVVSGASTLDPNIYGVISKLNAGVPKITLGESDSSRRPDYFLPVDRHEELQRELGGIVTKQTKERRQQ